MVSSIFGWAARRLASWGLQVLLGYIAPIIQGIAQVGGAIITAIAEIIMALAKSPEGRVFLGVCATAVAFLFVRFHYIEEGKAMSPQKTVTVAKPCFKAAKGATRLKR